MSKGRLQQTVTAWLNQIQHVIRTEQQGNPCQRVVDVLHNHHSIH